MEKMTIEEALKFAEFELWNKMATMENESKVISTLRLELEDAHAHVQSALNILNFG